MLPWYILIPIPFQLQLNVCINCINYNTILQYTKPDNVNMKKESIKVDILNCKQIQLSWENDLTFQKTRREHQVT